jgi:hypothetical protein
VLRADAVQQPVAQRSQARGFARHLVLRQGAGRAQPDDSGTFKVPERRPRSWPPPSVCGSRRTRRWRPPHVESADTFRAIELVRRERQQIDRHRVDVERDLADRLRRIGVEQDIVAAR